MRCSSKRATEGLSNELQTFDGLLGSRSARLHRIDVCMHCKEWRNTCCNKVQRMSTRMFNISDLTKIWVHLHGTSKIREWCIKIPCNGFWFGTAQLALKATMSALLLFDAKIVEWLRKVCLEFNIHDLLSLKNKEYALISYLHLLWTVWNVYTVPKKDR